LDVGKDSSPRETIGPGCTKGGQFFHVCVFKEGMVIGNEGLRLSTHGDAWFASQLAISKRGESVAKRKYRTVRAHALGTSLPGIGGKGVRDRPGLVRER